MAEPKSPPATKKDLQLLKKEILEGVQVMHENLLYDFRGIFNDRTEQLRDTSLDHEKRITKVERILHVA